VTKGLRQGQTLKMNEGQSCKDKDPGETFSSWWLNHPSERYARHNGNLPQMGVKMKNI